MRGPLAAPAAKPPSCAPPNTRAAEAPERSAVPPEWMRQPPPRYATRASARQTARPTRGSNPQAKGAHRIRRYARPRRPKGATPRRRTPPRATFSIPRPAPAPKSPVARARATPRGRPCLRERRGPPLPPLVPGQMREAGGPWLGIGSNPSRSRKGACPAPRIRHRPRRCRARRRPLSACTRGGVGALRNQGLYRAASPPWPPRLRRLRRTRRWRRRRRR
mmetsp:Transcript_45224/g.137116  ORF Transcript_45224/g.137116 Transcript_45224/m.137116 type:complete len:220 (-) Transcript_45224:65-724(-)